MSRPFDALKTEAASLSARERAELAHFLMDSLDSESAEAAWDAELERRAVEIQDHKVNGIPAEQVFAEIRSKYT